MPVFTAGSPNSNNLEIGIAIVLKDRFSNQAREASAAIRQLHRDAKSAINANLQAANTASMVGMGAAVGMGNQIKNIVQEGANFVDTMTTVKVISGATAEQSETLGRTAKALGESTMLYARDVASGMQYLAMSGNKAQAINNMITSAAHMAVATNMELGGKGGTADLLTNVMHMFNLEGEKAAGVVGDQLTKAALSSNISMMDLAETVKYAGTDMVMLGQTLPQVAAMAGVLGNAGIQASMAGTAMSNMARYFNKSISDPGFKGGKALAKLGLTKEDFVDSKGALLDFGIVLGKIKEALKSATPTEQSAVMLDIFGVRGLRAGNAIMTNLETYKTLLHDITFESQGFMANIVATRMDTLAGSLDQMVSTLENIRIAFAQSLEPVLKPVFQMVTKIFGLVKRVFEIPIFGTLISSAMTFGVALLGIGSAIMFIRTKWLILRNDSQVTGNNMFALLMGGWEGARLKAERYMAVENAIIAQRKAGIGGDTPFSVMGSQPHGTVINGVKKVVTKSGKTLYYQQTAEGGWKRVSEKLGAGLIATATDKQTAEGVMDGAARNKVFRDGATKIFGGSDLKSIGGFLGKAIGFLTGPWGIAYTTIATMAIGIPLLKSALGGLKRSVDESTTSTDDLNGIIKQDIAQRKIDNANPNYEDLVKEMRALVQSIQYWANNGTGKKPQVISINIDGKETMRQVLKEYENDVNIDANSK